MVDLGVRLALIQDPYCTPKTRKITGFDKKFQIFNNINDKIATVSCLGTAPIEVLNSEHIITVKIENPTEAYYVSNVYIPPSDDFEAALIEIETALNRFPDSHIIAGDWNAASTLWGYPYINRKGQNLTDMMLRQNLDLVNIQGAPHTREGGRGLIGWPDITFSTSDITIKISKWKVLEEETMSDHRYIHFSLNADTRIYHREKLETKLGKHKKFENLIRKNSQEFRDTISTANSEEDLNTATTKILESLKTIALQCYKIRKKSSPKNSTWWTQSLSIRRKKVNAQRRRYQREQEPELRQQLLIAYKRERAMYKREVHKAKKTCWIDMCSQVTGNYGLQYKIAASKTDHPTSLANILDSGTFPSIQNIANKFLDTLFITDINIPHLSPPLRAPSGFLAPVSPAEINRILSHIKTNKAPGYDLVDYNLLKRIHRAEESILTSYINKCLQQHHFPKPLKIGIVVLFHKSGKPLDKPDSYRPVCLLPALGKVLERVILGRINHSLTKHDYVNPKQYGFKQGVSTEHALKNLMDTIRTDKEEGNQTVLVSFDIKGAFDSIRWPSVMDSLRSLPCPPYLYNITNSFLTDRSVTITENGVKIIRNTFGGAPQGSCLGPFLWSIIADKILHSDWGNEVRIQAFADDFILIIRNKYKDELVASTNEAIKIFNDWTISEHLTINWAKTKVLYLNRPHNNLGMPISYKLEGLNIGDRVLHTCEHFRYLGVTLHKNGQWIVHCKNQVGRAHEALRSLQYMRNKTWGIKPQFIRLWYKTVIEKILLYAAPIWGNALDYKSINILQACQRHFTVMISRAYATASLAATQVLSGTIPIELMASYEAIIGNVLRLRSEQTLNGITYNPTDYEKDIKVWTIDPASSIEIKEDTRNTNVHIYTDGSKTEEGTGSAFIRLGQQQASHTWKKKLKNNNSVFQAEQFAILNAIKYGNILNENYTIYSDSMSAIQALNSPFTKNRITNEILSEIKKFLQPLWD